MAAAAAERRRRGNDLSETDMVVFEDRPFRVRWRLCDVVADRARGGGSGMDHVEDVYRYSGHFADDSRSIGINSATYIGYVTPGTVDPAFASPWWGLLGSVLCTFVVVAPSYLLVLYTSHFIARHKESAAVQGVFKGLRPVTIGLIASAALLLMNADNFGETPEHLVKSVVICAAAFAATFS